MTALFMMLMTTPLRQVSSRRRKPKMKISNFMKSLAPLSVGCFDCFCVFASVATGREAVLFFFYMRSKPLYRL